MEWPVTIDEAIALQERLRRQVVIADAFGEVRTVAGVDVGFEEGGTVARAAVVVLDMVMLTPLTYALARRPVTFPYVPGLLSFREAPAILAAMDQLRQPPDLLICDGQGIAHPRRFGIACHLGIITGLPTIGCAKTILVGAHAPLPDSRGARVPLMHQGEHVGWALRTRPGAKPVYVSPGHRVGLVSSAELVMACVTRYRLPEATRYAHSLASHGAL